VSIGIGSRVGPYDVVAKLGEGGMGEVYRARDSRLNRDVALKVLPDAFAGDPERLGRFEREAQSLAALKHPHIATIYGLEERDGSRALVLELIEGPTLAEVIARGPLAPEEAVRIAAQIADALDAAHEQGIVHRDLKPANIKITSEGAVKVLDFGLVKLTGAPAGGSPESYTSVAGGSGFSRPDLTMSPTMTSPAMLTGATVLMGTAGYMAPEQARGRPVDRRADVWAFGVVLFEMLTGTRAFAGESVTEVVGAVIHKDPDWKALPPSTPPVVRMVLERCLQKEPRQRFRDIGDVRLALEGAFTVDRVTPVPVAASPSRRWLPLAAALVAAVATGAAVWLLTRPEPVPQALLRFDLQPPAPQSLVPLVEISPDGRTVAFVALDSSNIPRIWIRPLDATESRLLTPSDETRQPIFWSPDSRYVAFFAEGKVRRVPVAGGPTEAIADATTFMGGSWSRDNVIVFSDAEGIVKVPATGGKPERVTVFDKSRGSGVHFVPRFLPDGRRFLYMQGGNSEHMGLYVGSIDAAPQDQNPTRLLATGSAVVYAPGRGSLPDHLLFVRDGRVLAQPFDPARLTLAGDPVPVLSEQIETIEGIFPVLSVAENGTLVYRRGGAPTRRALTATDRMGTRMTLLDGTVFDNPKYPRVSPDGRRLAMVLDGQLWSYDLAGGSPIKLTYNGTHYSSVWTPDGRRLIMEKDDDGTGQTLFSVAADGSSAAVQPVGPTGHYHPAGWAVNGDLVATRLAGGGAQMDLVRLPLAAGAKAVDIAATDSLEGAYASVSPDGRWVAYTTSTTGRMEVWVQSLTGSGAPVRISSNSGVEPRWSKDGRELFYIENGKMMAVSVAAGGAEFNFKVPVMLFVEDGVSNSELSYDMLPDGRFVRFTTDTTADFPLSVIVNWPELLAASGTGH
jgi:serine/threonine protein kinase